MPILASDVYPGRTTAPIVFPT